MFIIIWKGKGILVLGAMILTVILSAVIGILTDIKDTTIQMYLLELITGILLFIPIWIYGKKWNSEKIEFIDKKTGQEFTVKNPHTFFWIPMQYWAIIFPALMIVFFITALIQ
jgi:uncharacterized membrane protein YbhN (UPF0104 family)